MMRELDQRIKDWADAKGILRTSNPLAQGLKTLEEVTELLDAIRTNDFDEIADALGDIYVTIAIQSYLQGINLESSIANVVDIIEARTGKMVDGKFVKDD